MNPLLQRLGRCCIAAVVVAMLSVASGFGFVPAAEGWQQDASSCEALYPDGDGPSVLTTTGSYLVSSDGAGFFVDTISSVAIRSATTADDAVVDATAQVTQALADHYFGTDVEVFTNLPGASARAVIVDGDVAVPNQPLVFTIGGTPTLYVHWTTAAEDIATLLTQPDFEAIVADGCGGHPSAAPPPASPPLALPEPGAADEVLAYVDEVSTGAGSAGALLADTAPAQGMSPLPILGAALAVAAGGVVVHRRDRIWGDRFSPLAPPGDVLLDASRTDAHATEAVHERPRVIVIEGNDAPVTSPTRPPVAGRQIDLHSRTSESPLTQVVQRLSSAPQTSVLTRDDFARRVDTEWTRHHSGGGDGAVVSLVLSELDAVRLRLGKNAADRLFAEVAGFVAAIKRPLDVIGEAGDNELAILMPDVDEARARKAVDHLAKKIATGSFRALGERVLLTPATGFAMLSDTQNAPDLIRAVESARAMSMLNLDLGAERWDRTAPIPHATTKAAPSLRTRLNNKLRTPIQIVLTFGIAWLIPFLVYVGMDAIGFDISFAMYLILVGSLVITGAFILAEGVMALRQKEPPELPPEAFPKASALIAAYLPNEAATVIETIEAFLAIDYPNDLQIILAYNTPDPLPVEEHLDRIAAEHPNFVPVRVVGSNSKAQNVNAALSMAEGEFIGMFDADHQPRPDAFTRAWRWIDSGYDVVQGHCLTRNGDAGWLAKMIAVEFESIYAVAHPGRARMHRFGVFGGSNGFWRTELLHETRMRGSMLTEDIDSSMRVVGRGFKIRSDRDLVSRELATTTFQQIWNQRMRWAQGWFQVSIEHMKLAFRSKRLNRRQKMGVFHLLMWRELYPWLSQQLFPLMAFWALRAGGVDKLDWTVPIFVATTIFTLSVGPLQTLFAYRLADQEIKQHKSWFVGYLLFSTFFYTEYKNLIARVAHIKQLMGESDWRVTPRSADPRPVGD